MSTIALNPKLIIPNGKISRQTFLMVIALEVIIFLVTWFISPTVFLPHPTEVFKAFGDLWGQGIAEEVITSFTLNLQAVLLSTVLSLGIAYLGTVPVLRPLVEAIGKLRFLSMVGLTFFFGIMTHSGHALKLSLLVFSVSVFFVTGMADVIASIPKEQYDLARVLHMGPWRTLWEVVILGQFDKALDVMRQNAAMGWMMLSFVESISRSEGGVGAMLVTQNKYFHMPEIFAIQIVILFLGLVQDYSIGGIKHLMCPYAFLTTEK